MNSIAITNKYASLQNELLGNRFGNMGYEAMEEFLQEFFNKRSAITAFMDFTYAVDLTDYKIYYQDRLVEYLEYPAMMPLLKDIRELLHPDEQEQLLRFYKHWFNMLKKQNIKPESGKLKIVHQIKKGDHSYLKILHYIMPLLINAAPDRMIFAGMCTDVTKHTIAEGITCDFNFLYNNSALEPELIYQLEGILHPQEIQFTDRELEVLKAWSELPSVAMASERLEISERTFSTHLRNMRRKLNVHRTVDVMLYVQERGLG